MGALSLSPSNHLRPGGLIVVVKSAGLVHGTHVTGQGSARGLRLHHRDFGRISKASRRAAQSAFIFGFISAPAERPRAPSDSPAGPALFTHYEVGGVLFTEHLAFAAAEVEGVAIDSPPRLDGPPP